jgi:hypothetical protein
MKLIIAILLLAIGAFAQNTTYKDGTDCECDSIRSDYYTSGELMSEVPYINGKPNGTHKLYHANGNLQITATYNNGKQHGTENWYYRNGNLQFTVTYNNGKRHGIDKEYFRNGNLAGTATYNNGKLIGYKKCTDGRVGNEKLNCLIR